MTEILRLPGLVDVHVHLREPGQTEKEDFSSGTRAALAGGFTTVCDMPNNAEPITTLERLEAKIALAQQKAVCDIGFHYGTVGDNLDTFAEAAKHSIGLKVYLNNTTGGYTLDPSRLKEIYAAWPRDQVVLLHTEEDTIDIAIASLEGLSRPVHVCHMPSRVVLEKIMAAKAKGLPVTCGVTPHHLFLTENDVERLGVYGMMKPPLKSQADQDFLWAHLDDIDIFESDHAPHTHADKQAGAFGVPNLETTLPLLLKARAEGKITLEQIIDKCFTNPSEIFGLPTDDSTYVDVKMEPYVLHNADLQTKCGWSPWDGEEMPGHVTRVVLHGQTVYENGTFPADLHPARVLTPFAS
ncbi:amidohydrolase family protein [Candidatus Saccharibacteria bacterium]|nr:MAG: amidohydrolase family protein [Candidatus Saccharibacteria bacterium]